MKHPNFIDGVPDEATAAKVLSHPLRRRLLNKLHARGPLSPTALAPILELSAQSISHHLRALQRARFVKLDHEARRRGAIEHFYRAILQAGVEVWNPDDRNVNAD